eukprot:gene2916-4758_t
MNDTDPFIPVEDDDDENDYLFKEFMNMEIDESEEDESIFSEQAFSISDNLFISNSNNIDYTESEEMNMNNKINFQNNLKTAGQSILKSPTEIFILNEPDHLKNIPPMWICQYKIDEQGIKNIDDQTEKWLKSMVIQEIYCDDSCFNTPI